MKLKLKLNYKDIYGGNIGVQTRNRINNSSAVAVKGILPINASLDRVVLLPPAVLPVLERDVVSLAVAFLMMKEYY